MEMQECLDRLIAMVKACPELTEYKRAREKLKEYPDKVKRVQEFRKKNYRLHNSEEEVDLFTEADRIADEFRDVYQDPIMQDYLQAEAGICKVVQWIDAAVISSIDFEPLDGTE